MDTQEAKIRGERAKQLLEDPLLLETFAETEKALLAAAKLCKSDSEAHKAVIALQVFDLLKSQIRAHIETAKIVEFNFREKKLGIF